ncbi:MAG: DEAD/DEAH box helicase family protein [Solirubrobacterales bacterium]
MEKTTDVAASAAKASLSDADLERVREFTREPVLLEGERIGALAPGTARRRAVDAALAELDDGAEAPSAKWRSEYSLMLGLERLLADEPPKLLDGAELSEHQVDALSGTLAALVAELELNGESRANGSANAEEPDAEKPDAGSDPVEPGDLEPDGSEGSDPTSDSEDAEEPDAEEPEEPDAGSDPVEPGDPDLNGDLGSDPTSDAGDVGDLGSDPTSDAGDLEADDADDLDDDLDDVAPEPEDLAEDEEPQDWDEDSEEADDEVVDEAPEDPGADRRFWFEHATGAGKTVAAVGFIDASRTGGVLILTHRRNLVDQFIGEISDRGYKERLCPPLLDGADHPYGPVTVETYQWFVRNSKRVSDAYSIAICDEAHTALGEKTSACVREWPGPVFIGMTATGALIARHVADLFPTQTSRFDLAQAARRGVISPLRCLRIPPGPGVRTIAKVPLRKGEVDQDFDQEELAKLLDQEPFNVAIADLYRSRFRNVPGVVYTAGVRHAGNVAAAFRDAGINAQAVSGETPKRDLAEILAGFERGEVDVLCNAMLLAEGWNSPRATICMHLAPTASRRVYQQRVGRVTRRAPGKEAGLVIDLVHPATTSDETIVTLHSLLDRDVYRGGAIVVGPVRRGRGRRVRVERRVVPVSADPERRLQILERELWRIAVENLNFTEQHAWAALAGARVTPNNWRRAKAMIQHDQSKELRRRYLLTCVQRNRNHQLRLKALGEIAALRDAEAFDDAAEVVASWPRDERRAGVKALLQTLAEQRIGRRDQAQAWVWRLASLTRELHEEYAVQRWPETKRLLGLFVNSSGRAHGRNARRIVHAARQQDRRLAVALLAAAVAHTPEAEEVLRGARMRMARKPSAVARELLRNFPKSGGSRRRRRRGGKAGGGGNGENGAGRNGNAKKGEGRGGREREKLDASAAEAEAPAAEDAAS